LMAGWSDIEKRIVIPATNDMDRELQRWNDDLYLVSQITKSDPRSLKMYEQFTGTTIHSELQKALNTSATGAGLEWIPTQLSADVVDRVRLSLKVANLFQTITMPTSPYKPPVVSADATGYLQPESTQDDATKMKASRPTTAAPTFQAVKLAARTVFSEEVNEDSIIPMMPWLKTNIPIAIATAEEKALINGDTTTTHMDSNITDAQDAQKAWKGLRYYSLNGMSGAMSSIATFNADNMRVVRKLMGRYGVDPSRLAWIVGLSGYIQLLGVKDSSGNSLVTTIDKYGPNATIVSGELAKFDGSPVIVSEWLPQNLNASGVYDGTTVTKTVMLLVYTAGFAIGDRRKITVKTGENIETDQQILVCTERKDFKPWHAVTELLVGQGYNLTA
jgi:HK97 family phage major capsid protein